MRGLTVGQIATRAGVKPQTIHYYERLELLPPAPRTESNYRLYAPAAVSRVRFIKDTQRLGFTLAEIKELLTLRAVSSDQCIRVRARALHKVEEIRERIRTLETTAAGLENVVLNCDSAIANSENMCPIIAEFEKREDD